MVPGENSDWRGMGNDISGYWILIDIRNPREFEPDYRFEG